MTYDLTQFLALLANIFHQPVATSRMIEWLAQTADSGIILSNILGGVIALCIAVGVSHLEFNRQAQKKKDNWYRSVHNTCVRARGGSNIEQRGLSASQRSEYGQLYSAFAKQLQQLLPNAPTDEVGLELFNSLQNVEVSCLRYSIEVNTPNPHGTFLESKHETIMDFCLIAQYIIEKRNQPNITYLDILQGDELAEAEEKYQAFVNGELYK